jgi:hypothetical protein
MAVQRLCCWMESWCITIQGITHLLHKESNSPTFLPLNVMEKVILIEQFHGQYIVIGIQAVNAKGVELEHVHCCQGRRQEGPI